MVRWYLHLKLISLDVVIRDIKKPPKGGFFMSEYLERITYPGRDFAIGLRKKLTGLAVVGQRVNAKKIMLRYLAFSIDHQPVARLEPKR